ncbi:hypothetical protein C8Q80DRAFT_487509 [Daedaleopsis nitida]|nr:hypothetical protein C8Q80DRAFT_487509 [Daedaleopsis nitida]
MGVRHTLKSWWLILWRREAGSLNGCLYALFHPGEPYNLENASNSFPALGQLYTSIPTLPHPSSSLYSCFVSRVEYSRTVHGGDSTFSDFVVAHIRHPCASRCVGYIVISTRPPDNHNIGLPTSGDVLRSIEPTAIIADTYDGVLDVLRRDGCTKSQALLHAEIATHACPISYLVAAGQVLHEHYSDREHVPGDQRSWFGAVLFRLVVDDPDQTVVTRTGRKLHPELLSLAMAAHLDDCAEGLEMRYDAEITNIRVLVEAARVRRRAANAEQLGAWKEMEGPSRAVVNIALDTAMAARDAALVTIKMAEQERTLRQAAEARERKLKDALQAVRRRAEARERTLRKSITMLKSKGRF